MLLFGLLGVMFVVGEYHVAIGILVADIMIISMMISVIIFLEYYFGYHVSFGLLVASVIFIMMLDDIMFWSMMLEVMFACGS